MKTKEKSKSIRSRRKSKTRYSIYKSYSSLILLGLFFLGAILGLFAIDRYRSDELPASLFQNQWLLTPTKAIEYQDARANLNPERRSCPENFYFYENSTYLICYPDQMVPYFNTIITDPASHKLDRRVVHIADNDANSYLDVIPSFELGAYRERCIATEQITVSGYPATRMTYKDPNKEECGDITSILTVIDIGKQFSFALNYGVHGEGKLRFIDKYPTFEQSLKIK